MKKLLLLSILLAGTCGAVEYAGSGAALGGLNKAMAGKQAGPVVDAWKALVNAYIREYGKTMSATELKEVLLKISDRAFARLAELNKTTKEEVAAAHNKWIDESIEKKGVRKIVPTEPVKPGEGKDWTDADWAAQEKAITGLLSKKPLDKKELQMKLDKAEKLLKTSGNDIVKQGLKDAIKDIKKALK